MATAQTHPPSRYRFVVEALLFLTYAAFGLSWIAITPLIADIQAEFQIGSAQIALLNTMVSVAKVIAPLLTGWIAMRLGMKKTIALGCSLIACAVIAPFAHTYPLFLASRFVFGIGGAIVVTLFAPMVMQWFPPGERPLVNAFNNVSVNTGITITLFATVPLAHALGWRYTLLAYGLISVALALAWFLLGRERASAPRAAHEAPAPTVRYADVWRMKETWIVAVAFAGPLALYLAFNTWLPKYYVEAFHMTPVAASQYTGLFNLVGIPTAILAGFIAQRTGLRRPFIIGAGLLMGFAALGMFWLNSPVVIGVSAVLLGIALFTYVGPLFTVPMELDGVTPQHVGLMMGTIYSFAYLFSSLSPVVVGWLHDATHSFVPGFTIWAVFSWVLALAGWLLPETGPRGRRPTAESPPSGPSRLAG